jgi:hypothetical protein
MATSINSYSVGLGMDASGYIDGAKLSRSETKKLVADIESARSPAEKFAREQDRLTEALNKGAISQSTYTRLLDSKRTSLMGAATSSNVYAAALGAVATAGAAVVAGGVAFVAHLRSVQNEIDETIDAAGKLGVTYNELNSLRFAAQEGGGVDAATTDAAIKKMLINISAAVDGDENIKASFAKLGLDAGELIKQGPVESVMQIADAMKGVDSQADKLALSMEIFGKSGTELVSTLDQGSSALQESIDFQQQWNSLTEEQLVAVGANNDAWDRVGVVIEGISTKLAAEFAPAMLVVADTILSTSDGFESIDQTVRNTVDTTVYLVGVLKDALELITVFQATTAKVLSGDISGAVSGIGSAVDFSSGEQAVQAVNDKRLELEQKARESEDERAKKREAMLAAEHVTKESKAEESARKEAERTAEAERKAEQSRAERALKEANTFFEQERKKEESRRKDMAKGPGSGMEVGSAEAAKYMADQMNQAIGGKTVPENGTPTDDALLQETTKQSELLQKQEEATKKQTEILSKMLDGQRDNKFKRIR